MIKPLLRKSLPPSLWDRLRRLRRFARDCRENAFLAGRSGVVHVGANWGQEAALYHFFRLHVLWIEPLPFAYDRLSAHIARYPRQRALQRLVTDKEGELYAFHVADNEGGSSSIFPFGAHEEVFPGIQYESQLRLKSTTLQAILEQQGAAASLYDVLVLDVQGAELLVLQGAGERLEQFRYVKAEAADFSVYDGGCQLRDLDAFLSQTSFRRSVIREFAHVGNRHAFDVLYKRK